MGVMQIQLPLAIRTSNVRRDFLKGTIPYTRWVKWCARCWQGQRGHEAHLEGLWGATSKLSFNINKFRPCQVILIPGVLHDPGSDTDGAYKSLP